MAAIPSVKSWSVNEIVKAADLNGNFTAIRTAFNNSAMLTDTAVTVTVSHTWTAAQSFPSGSTIAGYLPLAGGTLTGGLTGTTASFSGAVQGATVTATGLATASAVAAGANPASVGAIRIPNNVSVASRDAANTGNVVLIYADASNQINLGTGNSVLLNGGTQINGALTTTGALAHTGSSLGFFGTAPTSRVTVTGSRAGADSLAVTLLTILGQYGLVVNNTTP